MRTALILTLSAFCCLPAVGFADSCADIVADTIAEVRAGADGWWSEDAEDLVRVAAGSACIKAQSGRYGELVPSAEKNMSDSTAAQVAAPSGESTKATDAVEASQADDGSWSFGGLTFRSMSGSPTQKPYERQRQSKQEEQ